MKRIIERILKMPNSSTLWESNLKKGDVLNDIEAKARAYLLKYLDIESLMADINVAATGNAIISQAIAGKLADFLRSANVSTDNNRANNIGGTLTLSKRELEVLQLIAGGARNREVANQLYISEATVKTHLRNIMDKLQTKNRAQTVARAISYGMLEY